jgi:substrate import-associated zinc metallohydrolase lipoprotein
MAYKKIIILFVVLILTNSRCGDPYNDINTHDGEYVNNDPKYPPTELDTWLYNSFTAPYNIEVKYRWDNSEVDPYKNLVPPSVGKVQDVMDVVKRVWIDTYSDIAGADFIKQYCPKQFILVGSGSYNFDGSTTLGTAEGGRKILLYVINHFDADDQEGVKDLIHTVEHEFAHILHQNISYPAEFKQITGGSYTANWSSVPESEARARGFITSYAMASPDEDFVEMISVMLVEGKQGYEKIIACETNSTSRQLLRTKEQTVIEYFRRSYNIDFYELQTKVQEAIQEIAPGEPAPEKPPVFDEFHELPARIHVPFLFRLQRTHKTRLCPGNVLQTFLFRGRVCDTSATLPHHWRRGEVLLCCELQISSSTARERWYRIQI